MAQSKKRKSGGKGGGKGRGGAPATVGGATGRPRRQANPIKGMAIGGLVIVLLAVFFFVQVGGKTPFNHLLGVFGAGEVTDASPETPAPQGKTPARTPAAAKKLAAKQPAVARNAKTAPPMERVTAEDQAGLYELIEKSAH